MYYVRQKGKRYDKLGILPLNLINALHSCKSRDALLPLLSTQEAALHARRAEAALRQKLSHETTDLGRAAVAHAEATQSLVVHRQRTREEKHMLSEEAKVNYDCV